MSDWESKEECRKHFRHLLKSQREYNLKRLSQLTENLIRFLQQHDGIWAAYQPLPEEADIVSAVSETKHLQWVYPRIAGDKLSFFDSTRFEKNSWGLQQPVLGSVEVDINQLTGLLIPGLAFSVKGQRLGRGKGFFDKTLQASSALKVGVGWHQQLSLEDLPTEAHDVLMDWVVTDQAWVDCRKREVKLWK